MKNSVIEIVSIIIKRMLKDEYIDQEEVITELVDDGYEVEDIDKAFALILAEENIIDEVEENPLNFINSSSYNRIFTASEKMYLPLKIQGIIYQLITKNLLTANESEKLISRTLKKVYNSSINIKSIWNILNDILDEKRLELLTSEIKEFNELLVEKYKYIN